MDMMAIRRAVILGQSAEKYLEFDGTFYLNTSYNPTADTQVIVEFSSDNDNTINSPIYGCRKSATSNQFWAWSRVDANGRLRVQRDYARVATGGTFDYILDPTLKYVINTATQKMTQNGVEVGTWEYNTGHIYTGTDYPIFIGAINNAGSPLSTYRFVGKIYSFRIYEGSTLAVNYVPYQNTLRDTISGTVLTRI